VTRGARPVALFLLLGLALPFPVDSRQDPDLDALLQRVAAYERRIPGVVSEEVYTQEATFTPAFARLPTDIQGRRLKSDVAVIAIEDLGWASFRDVYEVDRRAVRGRDERLAALFLEPRADTLEQARRITEEGARYNLNMRGLSISRTINNPMLVLRFLRADNQLRSSFIREGSERIDKLQVVVVTFEEQGLPRLIRSRDDAAASGRIWVEPETGRVVRTELLFETSDRETRTTVRSTVRAQFGPVDSTDLWVPIWMEEDHAATSSGNTTRIAGRATYSNVRTFRVEVGTIIK
jgi:hypothetical protein